MSHNTKTKPAASRKKAGYSPSTQTSNLAEAWLAYCQDPSQAETENAVAFHLDELFKRSLPDGAYKGVLKGREHDVRQEAFLLLVRRYLAGNMGLHAATTNGDRWEIENQVERSLLAALRSVSRNMKKSAWRHLRLHEYGQDIDICPQAACIHPSDRKSLWELPFQMQRRLVFAALRMGLQSGLFCSQSVNIASSMLDGGHSQSHVAKALGISRQAVHAKLCVIRQHLKKLIEKQEFPLA